MMEQLLERSRTLGDALKARGWTLATAESCTGGLIGHLLTEIAGSSAYYLGGIVSYSNAAKRDLLGVREELLDQHGAVSAQVALAMAEGAVRRFGTDVALSATGIAGPGGGSDEKPVGLVYLGLALPGRTLVERHIWKGDRSANKRESAARAIEMLLEVLRGEGVVES